ncbi:hypothetical protein GF376_00840 [Candidatus Peregrinibacteria bacterium]|nr:hypothetical protein [Candidatus Peregrinibacteria bacterium]
MLLLFELIKFYFEKKHENAALLRRKLDKYRNRCEELWNEKQHWQIYSLKLKEYLNNILTERAGLDKPPNIPTLVEYEVETFTIPHKEKEMEKPKIDTEKVVKEIGIFRMLVMGVLLSTLVSMILNSYNRIRHGFFKKEVRKE